MPPTDSRRRWGGRRAQRLRVLVLARDTDPDLGYAPCRHCGQPADSVDHWPIPRSQGGPDTPDNLISSCLPCNVARGVALARDGQRPPAPSRQW